MYKFCFRVGGRRLSISQRYVVLYFFFQYRSSDSCGLDYSDRIIALVIALGVCYVDRAILPVTRSFGIAVRAHFASLSFVLVFALWVLRFGIVSSGPDVSERGRVSLSPVSEKEYAGEDSLVGDFGGG